MHMRKILALLGVSVLAFGLATVAAQADDTEPCPCSRSVERSEGMSDERDLPVEVKNHRGEWSTRRVFPLRVEWQRTEWHGEGWVLHAVVTDGPASGQLRTFALDGLNFAEVAG